MANPFGITQVDVSGLFEADDKRRATTLQEMFMRAQRDASVAKNMREEEEFGWKRADRHLAEDIANSDGSTAPAAPVIRDAVPLSQLAGVNAPSLAVRFGAAPPQREFASGDNKPPAPGAVTPASSDDEIVVQGRPPLELPGAPASAVVPMAPPDPAKFRRLSILNPEAAGHIADTFSKIDGVGKERLESLNSSMGVTAMDILQYRKPDGSEDMEARRDALVRSAPTLIAAGHTKDEIAAFAADLSDGAVSTKVRHAQDVKQIFDQANADRTAGLEAARLKEMQDHNRREEALTASGQSVTMRGQNMTDARERRGQNMTEARDSRSRSDVTPSRVIGPILAKVTAGQQLTPGEARAFNMYKRLDTIDQGMGAGAVAGTPPGDAPQPRRVVSPATSPAAPARVATPRTAVNPKTGERVILVNGKWVPAR